MYFCSLKIVCTLNNVVVINNLGKFCHDREVVLYSCVFLFCFRDVAAAMAHSRQTQLNVYDLHGGVGLSARVRGHDALIRERGRFGGDESASDGDDDPDNAFDADASTAAAAPAPVDADAVPRAAAAASSRSADGRQERKSWTTEESQVLTSECRDFIVGNKRRYDSRDLKPNDLN